MTSPVFDAEAAAAQVMAALLPLADPERAVQASSYLKSDLDFLGISVPGIRAVVTGVNYVEDLARSADFTEVRALYQAAGLSLANDLRTLDSAPRISANPSAVAYLIKNISFNGGISVPVLTMHTTGDGLVVPENEQAYRSAVDRAGRGYLLRQVFVHRAGHCTFTPAETVTAVQTLENRLATGRWHVPSPAAMNAQAAALGPQLNIFSVGGAVTPTAPAFISYSPARYLRPFNLFP